MVHEGLCERDATHRQLQILQFCRVLEQPHQIPDLTGRCGAQAQLHNLAERALEQPRDLREVVHREADVGCGGEAEAVDEAAGGEHARVGVVERGHARVRDLARVGPVRRARVRLVLERERAELRRGRDVVLERGGVEGERAGGDGERVEGGEDWRGARERQETEVGGAEIRQR